MVQWLSMGFISLSLIETADVMSFQVFFLSPQLDHSGSYSLKTDYPQRTQENRLGTENTEPPLQNISPRAQTIP